MKRVLLDIWDGIRSQPGRTGLSFVAIGIGMVSLTILLAVIGGLRERSRQIIREIGANVFAILPQQSGATSETNDICESHAALVTANFPDCTVSVTRRFQAESPGIEGNVTVIATDENLARVRQWNLISGRFIDVRDMRTSDRVVVVSRALGNMRGWEIGHVVTLKNEPFTIIGIIDPQGDTVDSEQGTAFLSAGDKSAFVPITAAKL
jgi:putative ABC transport system permease protein